MRTSSKYCTYVGYEILDDYVCTCTYKSKNYLDNSKRSNVLLYDDSIKSTWLRQDNLSCNPIRTVGIKVSYPRTNILYIVQYSLCKAIIIENSG